MLPAMLPVMLSVVLCSQSSTMSSPSTMSTRLHCSVPLFVLVLSFTVQLSLACSWHVFRMVWHVFCMCLASLSSVSFPQLCWLSSISSSISPVHFPRPFPLSISLVPRSSLKPHSGSCSGCYSAPPRLGKEAYATGAANPKKRQIPGEKR